MKMTESLLKMVFLMNKIKLIVYLSCVIGSCLISVYLYKQFYAGIEDQQSFYLSDRISYNEAEAIISDNKFDSVVFWNNSENAVVSNPMLNMKIDAQKVEVMGSLSSLVTLSNVYDFSSGKECIISSDIASKLFGQFRIEGLQVDLEGKMYVVRNVVENFENTVIVYTSDSDSSFDYVTFQGRDIYRKDESSKQLGTIGISFEEISNSLLMFILNILLFILLICIMCAFSNLVLKKYLNKVNNDFIRAFFKSIYIVCTLIIFYFIFKKQFFVPSDWIPSKWSNNEFWNNLYLNQVENLKLFYKIQIPNILLFRYIKFLTAFISLISSIVLLGISWILFLNNQIKKLNN